MREITSDFLLVLVTMNKAMHLAIVIVFISILQYFM